MRNKNFVAIPFFALLLLACGSTKPVDGPVQETVVTENAKPQAVPDESKQDKAETVVSGKKPMSIEWLDFETAIDRNEKNPKYILIDIYTEWCGWCKKMDASTFVDADVTAYITEHFYAVKMDAEMREAIAYKGKLYEYKQFNARAGYNTLAVGLLDSKMSFPSFVILDKKEAKKGKIMGYKTAGPFLTELKSYVK